MAKIFYLGGGTHARGMLRAVVSCDQLQSLVQRKRITHVGPDFPQVSDAPTTLIEILQEEATTTWPAGFCRVHTSPTEFDEGLRFLPEPNISDSPKREARATGSGLIHGLKRSKRSGA